MGMPTPRTHNEMQAMQMFTIISSTAVHTCYKIKDPVECRKAAREIRRYLDMLDKVLGPAPATDDLDSFPSEG